MSIVNDSLFLSDATAAELLREAPWRRFAVLGDSLAAGIGEDTPGYPSGGWAATLGRVLQQVHPDLAYLNVAKRDLLAREVRATQIEPVLAFGPDLSVLICGGNDLLRRTFDLESVTADLDGMVGDLRAVGSDVLLFGLMDITSAGLIPPEYAPRLRERLVALADVNRSIAERHGAIYLRLTEHPAASDPSLYSSDLMHANARGHAVLASATVHRLVEHLSWSTS